MSTFTTVLVSVVSSAATAGLLAAVSFVELQAGSPGTPQTGHVNVTGNVLAGRIGVNGSPSLSRLQINETGSLQGLRSITGTGVAVYGQSNATTGLGAGGYFTSKSSGGRALVVEQQSPSGNTVGGLLSTASPNGTALWARNVTPGGTSTGVSADVSSVNGRAGYFANNGSGNKVTLGTGAAALLAQGDVQRKYGLAYHSVVPVAFGGFDSTGTILSGSGNWTVSYDAVNFWWTVTVTGITVDLSVDTAFAVASGESACFATVDSNGNLVIKNFLFDGTNTQSGIEFAFYQDPVVAGHPLANRHGYKTDLSWAKHRPSEFKAHKAEVENYRRQRMSELGDDTSNPTP